MTMISTFLRASTLLKTEWHIILMLSLMIKLPLWIRLTHVFVMNGSIILPMYLTAESRIISSFSIWSLIIRQMSWASLRLIPRLKSLLLPRPLQWWVSSSAMNSARDRSLFPRAQRLNSASTHSILWPLPWFIGRRLWLPTIHMTRCFSLPTASANSEHSTLMRTGRARQDATISALSESTAFRCRSFYRKRQNLILKKSVRSTVRFWRKISAIISAFTTLGRHMR